MTPPNATSYRELTAIYEDLKSMSGPTFMKRLMKKENHADLLSGHMSKITWAVEVFQLQNSIDIAASLELDQEARRQDAAHLAEALNTITTNDQRLEESLQLGFEGTASRMAEIRDLLLLSLRQKKECPPGPERKFYELAHKKMVSLSGEVCHYARLHYLTLSRWSRAFDTVLGRQFS